MQQNYYEILEIPSDADEREIKRAYHRLARDLHPDKATSPEEARVFEERFALVSAAYNALKDAGKRAEYDRQHKSEKVQKPAATPARVNPTNAVLNAGRGVPGADKKAASGGGSGPSRVNLGITPEKVAIAQKAYARGMQFFKEGNFPKAIEFFEAAIQNNDAEPTYHARLAMALIQAKRSATRAIEAAQRALELDPYNLEHKFVLAMIFVTIGSKSNAQKIYEEILRWDSGNLRAQQALKDLKKRPGLLSTMGRTSPGKNGLFDQLLSRFKK